MVPFWKSARWGVLERTAQTPPEPPHFRLQPLQYQPEIRLDPVNMTSKQRVLTGITTTGTPHLGNYVGAIKPAIAASRIQ